MEANTHKSKAVDVIKPKVNIKTRYFILNCAAKCNGEPLNPAGKNIAKPYRFRSIGVFSL